MSWRDREEEEEKKKKREVTRRLQVLDSGLLLALAFYVAPMGIRP